MGDEYVFCFEVAVIDVFVEEIVAALGELEEEGDGFGFRDVSVLLEVSFQVARWGEEYPPGQNSRKK